jgi:hypothetical protein
LVEGGESSGPISTVPPIPGAKPGTLRRVKIFAAMTNQQLGRFGQIMENREDPCFS